MEQALYRELSFTEAKKLLQGQADIRWPNQPEKIYLCQSDEFVAHQKNLEGFYIHKQYFPEGISKFSLHPPDITKDNIEEQAIAINVRPLIHPITRIGGIHGVLFIFENKFQSLINK